LRRGSELNCERRSYISDPKGKAKFVWLTDEGARLSEELFRKHLTSPAAK
jgi:Mn-dependent DtxR family transcriptional regulator